jgi:DNA-binding transcriptional ArsR family regulator
MDLVRSILLSIEASESPSLEQIDKMDGYSQDEVNYHLKLMFEAGLIHGYLESDPNSSMGYHVWHPQLKWDGHEFLDNIRDDEIWKKTKEGATKIGSWSLSVIGDVAKTIIKLEAKKHLGIDLGD